MRSLLMDTQSEVDRMIGAAPKVQPVSTSQQPAIRGGHVVKEVYVGAAQGFCDEEPPVPRQRVPA